jgi:hypothetical protein
MGMLLAYAAILAADPNCGRKKHWDWEKCFSMRVDCVDGLQDNLGQNKLGGTLATHSPRMALRFCVLVVGEFPPPRIYKCYSTIHRLTDCHCWATRRNYTCYGCLIHLKGLSVYTSNHASQLA